MIYFLLQIKRWVEEVLMAPFVWYGKMVSEKRLGSNAYDLFCFFPTATVGGAEKVNLELLKVCNDQHILVFFTKQPRLDSLLDMYQLPHVTIMDISAYTDDKWRYWMSFTWRGICAEAINSQTGSPVVFIGQCNFGYKLLPHLQSRVRKVELIHVAEQKFAWITFPYIGCIDIRTTVGDSIRQSHLNYYKWLGVPKQYFDRWQIVLYSIPFLFDTPPDRELSLPIKVYYAGRGGYQKRLWLLFEIIRKTRQLPIEWHLAGPFSEEIPADVREMVVWHGTITTQQEMYALHRKMDVLILTSGFEGFPVVIMEAMANGVVPIATSVDAIPEHITNGSNGYLIHHPENEDVVVAQAVQLLTQLSGQPGLLGPVSTAAYQYARIHFTRERFEKQYRQILFGT